MIEIKENFGTQLYKDGVAQEDNLIVLTEDQKRAVGEIINWYAERYSISFKKYFTLAGSAGTGKSSIIQCIIDNLDINKADVLCGALTGKATLNLRRKGNDGSNTLHSALYDCIFTKDGPIFTLKSKIYYKLIIIDEASMISEEMFNDIMSFGIPTIFIGDHCQLPPIEGKFNIMLTPDCTLTQIHRQAAESPIIQASQKAINGKEIEFTGPDFQCDFRKIKESELKEEDFLWADQIVCGFNKTRKALNALCREIRGFNKPYPEFGERMVVLKNNRFYNVFNGQIIYLRSTPVFDHSFKTWNCRFIDELEHQGGILALVGQEKNIIYKLQDPPLSEKRRDNSKVAYLDYGYVLSVHKAQGSGWDKVMVYDENFGFGDKDTYKRWLYTAITRAKKEVLLVEPEG